MKKVLYLLPLCWLLASCNKVYVDERIVYNDGTIAENQVMLKRSAGYYEYNRDKADFENIDSLVITPCFAHANAGDEGFFMNPRGYVTYFIEGRDDAVYKLPRKNQIRMTGIKTTYSDGTVTICNYSDAPYEYKGVVIPAENWKIFKKK